MTRSEICTYARQILGFIESAHQTRGHGSLDQWDQNVPVACLTQKRRALLKIHVGHEICLEDIRSWNPGMTVPRKTS